MKGVIIKLASIQTVNAVEPIPNADAIEKIRVLGWWVVVKKGEHKPGDKVVYCEIDSLLPERPEFEFLRASSFKPAQTDVTRRHPAGRVPHQDGEASRPGVAGHLLPALDPAARCTDRGRSGRHRSARHPEVGAAAAGRHGREGEGAVPGFLPKTDETRVQVLEPVLERHRGKTLGPFPKRVAVRRLQGYCSEGQRTCHDNRSSYACSTQLPTRP